MVKKLVFFLVLAAALYSCKIVQPAAPDIEISSITQLEQPLSTINIPVKLGLKPYFKKINQIVPSTFKDSKQQCEGVSYTYYVKRKPIEFSGIGDRIVFGAEGSYWVKLKYCPKCSHLISSSGNCIIPRIKTSCGIGNESMRKIRISYSSSIGISENYSLKSTTTLNEVSTLNPCTITVFNFDATSKLKKEIKKSLNNATKDIDTEISKVNFHSQMEQVWSMLWQPIPLNGYGYLYLKPKNTAANRILFKEDTAQFNISLSAYPSVSTDRLEIEPKALPQLLPSAKSDGFKIYVDVTAGYDSLSSMLTQELKGMKLDLKGRKFIFGDLKIYGAANQRLTIKVNFTGKATGSIFLVGTPIFDSEQQYISFPDLEYDLKTKNVLLKSTKWLFDKKITDLLRQSATFDLKPKLNHLAKEMNNGLNQQIGAGITMSGKVDTIKIDLIHPQQNDLFLRLQTEGMLNVKL
jgi:hypothetical protein